MELQKAWKMMTNEEYQDLREHLKELVDFNKKGVRLSDTITTYDDAECKHPISTRKTTIDDYLEINQDDLACVCDYVGMSDLYLGQKLHKTPSDTVLLSRKDISRLYSSFEALIKVMDKLTDTNLSDSEKKDLSHDWAKQFTSIEDSFDPILNKIHFQDQNKKDQLKLHKKVCKTDD